MKNITVIASPATADIFNSQVNPYWTKEYDVDVISNFVSIASFNSKPVFKQHVEGWLNDENKLSSSNISETSDAVVFDLLSDVIFGWLELPNGKITNNVWKDKGELVEFKERGTLIAFKNDRRCFLEKLKDELNQFFLEIKSKNPDIKFIFNSIRYPLQMTVENLKPQNLSKEYPVKSWITDVNNILSEIEKLILNTYQDVEILKFNFKTSYSEYNHINGRNSFFYNESYYLEKLVDIEQKLDLKKIMEMTTNNEITSKVEDYDCVIVENLFEQENLLSACWYNEAARIYVNQFASYDFILDGAYGRKFRFIKRNKFYRAHLKKKNNIWYSEEEPTGKYLSGSENKKIVFMFMPLPSKDGMINPNMEKRVLPQMFGTLNKSVVKDTYIIRIADVNLIRGSFYVNTPNYEYFEEEVKQFIKSEVKDKGVKTKAVLYGASRGGVGALLYSIYLGIKSVSVDPVVDETEYVENQNDFHLVKGVREISLLPKFKEISKRIRTTDRIVIGNSSVPNTWSTNKALKKIYRSQILLLDLDDRTIISHPQVTFESIPLQLMFINKFLTE